MIDWTSFMLGLTSGLIAGVLMMVMFLQQMARNNMNKEYEKIINNKKR